MAEKIVQKAAEVIICNDMQQYDKECAVLTGFAYGDLMVGFCLF